MFCVPSFAGGGVHRLPDLDWRGWLAYGRASGRRLTRGFALHYTCSRRPNQKTGKYSRTLLEFPRIYYCLEMLDICCPSETTWPVHGSLAGFMLISIISLTKSCHCCATHSIALVFSQSATSLKSDVPVQCPGHGCRLLSARHKLKI